VKLAGGRVEEDIALLKVAVTPLLLPMPVAPLAGAVELTTGAVVSCVEPVVKVQTKLRQPAGAFRPMSKQRSPSEMDSNVGLTGEGFHPDCGGASGRWRLPWREDSCRPLPAH
jgi:hypothetical protein